MICEEKDESARRTWTTPTLQVGEQISRTANSPGPFGDGQNEIGPMDS